MRDRKLESKPLSILGYLLIMVSCNQNKVDCTYSLKILTVTYGGKIR